MHRRLEDHVGSMLYVIQVTQALVMRRNHHDHRFRGDMWFLSLPTDADKSAPDASQYMRDAGVSYYLSFPPLLLPFPSTCRPSSFYLPSSSPSAAPSALNLPSSLLFLVLQLLMLALRTRFDHTSR